MFEAAEIGQSVSKDVYKAEVETLRVELINAQFELQNADFPVVVLIVGDDRWAVSGVVDVLNEWMDARFIETRYYGPPGEEEKQRPRFWRYWRGLPPKGKIGLFLGAWVANTVSERLHGEIKDGELERRLDFIHQFELDLINDGALVLKFWLHLPKKQYGQRIELAQRRPEKGWYLDDVDHWIHDEYDKVIKLAERIMRKTDDARARWHIIESTDQRHCNLSVAKVLLTSITDRLPTATEPTPVTTTVYDSQFSKGALDTVDLSQTLDKAEYKAQLADLQHKLHQRTVEARDKGLTSVLVFEGWDAAGKGGVIRRITSAMAARDYRVVPIAAPSDEELARHYLWRFWRQLPLAGRMIVYDRSWYGRVLVERVEGLASVDQVQNAYAEINDFEEQLVDFGIPVLKFWLHLDPDEQLRRFRDRECTPYKKYKITEEDYRNREKWDDYVLAVNEMVARTSTDIARWHLISANSKRHARIEVLRCVCKALKNAL